MIRCLALAALCTLAATLASAQQSAPTPTGAVQSIQNFATGTTSAVTATLAASNNKTNFLCGLSVSGAGTGSLSPIVITGLLNGSLTLQGVSAGQVPFVHPFSPCLPASGSNAAISASTTADGTATGVALNIWGYAQ